MKKIKSESAGLWEWVKAICSLLLVGVLVYKIYITPFNVTVDFPTLLSLLLALFSVGLAALFYFKATETSNTFYDNTYNFTKDIAQLLAKIESGFGEKLRHLDEGYTSMRDYLQNTPEKDKDSDVEKTKKKISDEKQEIEKVALERNEIIKHLVEKSQLQQADKEKVLEDLAQKEKELSKAQKELGKMNRHLDVERMRRSRSGSRINRGGFSDFTLRSVIEKIGVKGTMRSSARELVGKFELLAKDLPDAYLSDMEEEGYFDDGLTREGVEFLRSLAAEHA